MVLGTLNTPEWKIKDEALKIISDARQALSSEDLDVSIPKKVAKLLKFNWNEERYREYVRDYSPDTYLNQFDIELFQFAKQLAVERTNQCKQYLTQNESEQI